MRVRLVLTSALAVLGLALLVSACGGGEDGADPASLAPAGTPVQIEMAVRPEGELQENIEALASDVAGIDDLGGLIVSELESSAVGSGEEFDFGTEMEPWLGEDAGLSLTEYDGEDFTGYSVAVSVTNTEEAQAFIEKQVADEAVEEGSYEGSDYVVEDDGTAVGLVGEFLVFSEGLSSFEAAVDAAEGDSLADDESFQAAMDGTADESFADVFIDVGALIEESGGAIDPETTQLLEGAGINAEEATAVASLVPGSDQIEIDFSSNAAGDSAPTGDASQLLGSLPGGAFAAIAFPGVGDSLESAIDSLDEEGIPGQIEPGELDQVTQAIGIDLRGIAGSITDVAVFAQGNTEENLTGALVIETDDGKQASETVAQIGSLLRTTGTPGVTALSGDTTGFSIRSPELGSKPLIVAAQGDRVSISYGLPASALALGSGDGSTLDSNPEFERATESLDGTPITAFVSGPAALALLDNALPPTEQAELEEVRPYLDKMSFMAIGSGTDDDLATAKMIVGFTE